jgi:hypothetical protein
MSGTWTHKAIHIFTAITEKGTKSFPKRLHHSINREDLTRSYNHATEEQREAGTKKEAQARFASL